MNLRMVYPCNLKCSRKYERWEEGECTEIIDQNHERSVFVLDHFRNFKDI